MKKVILLGNDHTNTLGLVQVLGREGYSPIAYVWGKRTGLVKSSKFCGEIFTASDEQECMNLIIESNMGSETAKVPIIACCDSAIICLEKNKRRLENKYLFSYTKNGYSINELCEKTLQVSLAKESGFNVPISWEADIIEKGNELKFPCIIKPQKSCLGAKCDLRICRNQTEFDHNISTLKFTKDVLVQQYIKRDYEISILGCAMSSGNVLIPCVENKLSLYPKNVGLECLANVQPLTDNTIIQCIRKLIEIIGYVGLFSVEMMHCKDDNKFYFTEINLRNDGANSFIYKYGINLPLAHIYDLEGGGKYDMPVKYYPGYYIWDNHHFASLIHGGISLVQWIKEIISCRGFLIFFADDPKPFFKQYTNWMLEKLRIRKVKRY